MIASLRLRHRAVSTALLVLVPSVAALAISMRAPTTDYAADARALSDGFDVELSAGGVEVAARWIEVTNGVAIEWVATAPPRKPDTLAYWAATEPRDADALMDAYLLGSAGGRMQSAQLPASMQPSAGYLALYSPAHQALLGSVAMPAPTPTRTAGAGSAGTGLTEEGSR